MAKYSTEFKLKIVKEYLECKNSYKSLAIKYNIPDKKTIRIWVNSYQTQGYDGLKVSRKNNKYTLEFKLKIVNLYLTGEMSYQSLANELKINNPSLIVRWVKDFREKGIEGLKPKKRGRPSKMPKKLKSSKNTSIGKETNIRQSEAKSSTEEQLKEEIKRLKEEKYWLELENAVIKKKIEFSQMTDKEIRDYLKSLDH